MTRKEFNKLSKDMKWQQFLVNQSACEELEDNIQQQEAQLKSNGNVLKKLQALQVNFDKLSKYLVKVIVEK